MRFGELVLKQAARNWLHLIIAWSRNSISRGALAVLTLIEKLLIHSSRAHSGLLYCKWDISQHRGFAISGLTQVNITKHVNHDEANGKHDTSVCDDIIHWRFLAASIQTSLAIIVHALSV